MLVATRDPHPGAHDAPTPQHDGRHPGPGVPRTARFVTGLQLAGSLLAIPVGLASAYSIYRANFSVETTCQALRANIVSMIDKQVDAGTKRMLVRRDVETFEKTCGGVDPDAEAAFKALLAADKASPPLPAAAVAVPRAAPEREVAHKAEPRPSVAVKQPASAEPAQRDAAVSDTKWLAAVRGALVSHAPDSAPAAERSRPAVATEAPPAAWPVPRENHEASKVPAVATAPVAPPVAPTPAPMAEPAPVATTAPALPPPTAVATVPAQRADPDHPVPPGTIPETNPAASDSWVGKIPFVGQALVR